MDRRFSFWIQPESGSVSPTPFDKTSAPLGGPDVTANSSCFVKKAIVRGTCLSCRDAIELSLQSLALDICR